MENTDKFLTIKEVGAILGVSEGLLYRLTKEKKIRHVVFGDRRIFFKRSWVDDYIKDHIIDVD